MNFFLNYLFVTSDQMAPLGEVEVAVCQNHVERLCPEQVLEFGHFLKVIVGAAPGASFWTMHSGGIGIIFFRKLQIS